MASYKVAKLADLEEHGRLVVEAAGRSIGVIQVDGRLFALRNSCPHQQGPLCDGAIFPAHLAVADAEGAVTEYLDHAQPVICCPWHGWEFDLRSGICLADPSRRVAMYPVTIDGDDIVLELRD